jgi:hypothetical protein
MYWEKSTAVCTGAEEAMAPTARWGNLRRNHAVRQPGYEPVQHIPATTHKPRKRDTDRGRSMGEKKEREREREEKQEKEIR